VDFALVYGVNHMLTDINADYFFLARRKQRSGGQADIAQTDHGNRSKHIGFIKK
jgi:hypothetical protein